MSRAYCGVCGLEWLNECDCKTISRADFDAMVSEWRSARDEMRRLNDHHHDPSLVPMEAFTQTLDRVLLGAECSATVVPPAETGQDGCS